MAPVTMFMTEGAPHRILEVNDAFSRLTGFASSSSVGQGLADLPIWENAAECDRCAKEVSDHGGLRGWNMRLLDRDGHAIVCLRSAERTSRNGRERALWLFPDITARRGTEMELADAMEAVMKDASWFSRTVMDKVAELRSPGSPSGDRPRVELSPREQEVLGCIGKGLEDDIIAERLGLSHSTVRNHVTRLYAKIGVKRRSAAVIWARERGYWLSRKYG